MLSSDHVTEKEAVVIGAGISGLATAKCLRDDGFEVLLLERTTDIGGLWKFREHDYGVMSFTHINVSKFNYCFSDYPFPESVPDYPHHSQMSQYISDYAQHFGLIDLIQFKVQVKSIDQMRGKWRIIAERMEDDGKTAVPDSKLTIMCSHLAVATGHHAIPTYPQFKGEETFPGEIIHSVDFNDVISNRFVGQRVLVVGIGNSAVDVAVNCAAAGNCPTTISTRSGAWVFSNYTMGFPTDLYITRLFFMFPLWARNLLMETIVKITTGPPKRWGLNPKMGILASQPTVSPTLIHHIQRHNVKIAPNISKIEGSTVHFSNGSQEDYDKIVYCTGYKMNLPFISDSLRETFYSSETNDIKLYKNVFVPSIGSSLAFIGFVQPASGGLICVSEIQARWFSALCKGQVKLPSKGDMATDVHNERMENRQRWFTSARHTIQKDPMVYTDDIASLIGAKPDFLSNPGMAWRLLLSTCGAAQWRLQGPHAWTGAAKAVTNVPMPAFSKIMGLVLGLLFLLQIYLLYKLMASVVGF